MIALKHSWLFRVYFGQLPHVEEDHIVAELEIVKPVSVNTVWETDGPLFGKVEIDPLSKSLVPIFAIGQVTSQLQGGEQKLTEWTWLIS